MGSHTPGPWEVVYCNRDLPPHVINKLKFKPVDVMIGEKRLRIADDESGDADARLIAAAPVLLDAAERAEWWLSTIPGSEAIRAVLRDAIAKAEGRT